MRPFLGLPRSTVLRQAWIPLALPGNGKFQPRQQLPYEVTRTPLSNSLQGREGEAVGRRQLRARPDAGRAPRRDLEPRREPERQVKTMIMVSNLFPKYFQPFKPPFQLHSILFIRDTVELRDSLSLNHFQYLPYGCPLICPLFWAQF